MAKLNLGCGYDHKAGWINADYDEECKPDLHFDLTKPDWPIKTSTIDEVIALHVLEHLDSNEGYLTFWKELYRVCQHDAIVRIEVPHWKHETFFHDPTHRRAITPVGIAMFDQGRNQKLLESNDRESKLGFQCRVDFEMESSAFGYDTMTGEPMNCYYVTRAVKPARFRR